MFCRRAWTRPPKNPKSHRRSNRAPTLFRTRELMVTGDDPQVPQMATEGGPSRRRPRRASNKHVGNEWGRAPTHASTRAWIRTLTILKMRCTSTCSSLSTSGWTSTTTNRDATASTCTTQGVSGGSGRSLVHPLPHVYVVVLAVVVFVVAVVTVHGHATKPKTYM